VVTVDLRQAPHTPHGPRSQAGSFLATAWRAEPWPAHGPAPTTKWPPAALPCARGSLLDRVEEVLPA
jgi:hypothetical protein